MKKCHSCGYEKTRAMRRGCCDRCYGRYRTLVEKGRSSWQALEEAGKVQAPRIMTAEWRARFALGEFQSLYFNPFQGSGAPKESIAQ